MSESMVATAEEISGNPFRAVLAVSEALVSSTVYEEVMANVAEIVGMAMSVWDVGISSYVAERDICIFEAWWCEGGNTQEDIDYVGTVAELRERPDLRTILDRPGVHVESIADRALPAKDREEMTKWGVKTSVDAALRVGDEVIGLLGLEEKRFVRDFTPVELDLFEKLCELTAIGIHNAMLFRRQQERARHLVSLTAIGHAFGSSADEQSLFDEIVHGAAEALGAPRAIVYEFDVATDMLTPRAIYQRDYDADYDTVGVAETVEGALGDRMLLTGGRPVVEHVSDPDLSADERATLERWGEKTALTVPIAFRGEALGVLMLIWSDRERQVAPDDLGLAAGIAGMAAMALRSARLRSASGDAGKPKGGAS